MRPRPEVEAAEMFVGKQVAWASGRPVSASLPSHSMLGVLRGGTAGIPEQDKGVPGGSGLPPHVSHAW